ncbi:MAG: FAD-dependent oxidoreductase [Thermomicrobiales bacterium]
MSGIDQIVVVGAGASGVAAAYAAATSGAPVILLDEQDAPGGWLRSSVSMIEDAPEMLDGKRGFEAASYATVLLGSSSVDYRPGTVAWGLFENGSLGVVGPEGAYQLRPSRTILATGSTEIVWPFAGWTLPGIMTARAARAFMHLHFVLPGRRVAVIGQGNDADQMAVDLEMAGADEVHRFASPDGLVAEGEASVTSIVKDGDRTHVDAVILALGSLPDPELARHALTELRYSESDGCHVPIRNAHMMTSVDGVFVVGDAGGMTSVAEAVAQGFVAGYAVTRSERLAEAIGTLTDISRETAVHESVGTASDIPDDVHVDREEQVTARMIRDAIETGSVSVNDVKRKTRAGMGVSQGRDTEYVIARMISEQTGISLDQLVPMTARPPARLVSLAALAQLATAVD